MGKFNFRRYLEDETYRRRVDQRSSRRRFQRLTGTAPAPRRRIEPPEFVIDYTIDIPLRADVERGALD